MLLISTELRFNLFCGCTLQVFFLFFLILRPFSIFHVLLICHIITLLTDHIPPYWCSKQGTIEYIKIFKDMDYGLNGFDTIFSKNFRFY